MKSLYADILFQDRKPIPNLMIRLNARRQEVHTTAPNPQSTIRNQQSAIPNPQYIGLARRFILTFATAIEIFRIRNIALLGDNPPVHRDFEFALKTLSCRVENLMVLLRPGQCRGCEMLMSSYASEVVFLIGPFAGETEGELREIFEGLQGEIEALRREGTNLPVRAILYLSAGSLTRLDEIIPLVESAGFSHLDFYPANPFITSHNERSRTPLNPALIPKPEDLWEIEENFREMLKERCFQSRLFDLKVTRRQIARVLNYFKAATGRANFVPPYCRASRIAFYIEPTGAVRCCPYQPIFGNLFKSTLIEIAQSESLRHFRASLNLARNSICPVCPGDYAHFLWRSR